ncbi:MAG TPA: hypothetical protein VEC01_19420 [Noviherbaspirillum sp.]|uniref:hypothetical protein n=1 Tax=Noviherbaspirillum sp. TaxID=1926288 RepID=UPI002D5BFF9E|nr:hypothetical protein [Noviherbaspirillum sp.]HYD97502.1 hypothetical protein [Noviherbaspirillum sp.]
MNANVRMTVAAALLCAGAAPAAAQQLDTHFSCSASRSEDGERVTYADNGEIRISGNRVEVFHWESALYRSTHGYDCNIDENDGLTAEVRNEAPKVQWRVALEDALKARSKRGYDFSRGMSCTIRLEQEGDMLTLKPTCPALCGSRSNFSELTVNLKTGQCRYHE